MRASTLLGLAIALMLGVVAVAGVRYSGILTPKPAPTPPKVEPILVLAAKKNLFEGITATIYDAGVRAATPAEADFFKQNPEKFFRPNPEAVNGRVLDRNVSAEEILLKEHFRPMKPPEHLSERLGAGMRAVDIEVPKDRAGAGLLRVGEYVDVFLTSKILTDPTSGPPRSGIAPIAKNLKIIVKRDILPTILAVIPEDKPISYFLEANPYRAALIEYSKSKGLLTLVAVPPGAPGPDAEELKAEQMRVEAFLQGKTAVTEADLERIFRLPPLLPKQAPYRVEYLTGTKLTRVDEVDLDGKIAGSAGIYRFVNPDDASAKVAQSVPPVNPPAGPPLNTISPKGAPPPRKKN